MAPGTWSTCGTKPIPLLGKAENPAPYWGNGSRGIIYAWTGAAFDGRSMYFTGSGHKFYGGNEIYAFDARRLRWRILTEPGRDLQPVDKDGDGRIDFCRDAYTDGTPSARHTYDGIVWAASKIHIFGGMPYCPVGASGSDAVWTFDPAALSFERLGGVKALPESTLRVKTAFDPRTGCVYVVSRRHIGCFGAGAWSFRARLNPGLWEATMDVTPDRRMLVTIGGAKEDVRVWKIRDDGTLGRFKRLRPKLPGGAERAGLAYDPRRRVFALWGGGRRVTVINSDDWSVADHASTEGPGPAPPTGETGRVYSKWAYIPDHDVFMGYSDHRRGVWFFRPRAKNERRTALGALLRCPNAIFGTPLAVTWDPARRHLGPRHP